jgi:hypothetical protein
MLDLQRLFNDPDQYLYRSEGEDAIFASMDRDAYHRSIFTDHRLSPRNNVLEKAPLTSLYEAQTKAGAKPRDVGYIFHIAHCGSTLLARALDIKDANLVCREPVALRQLGVMAAKSYPGVSNDWLRRADLVTTLLGRRYNPSGPVIVKANVPVNFMIEPLMQMRPEQPAIFLHFSLEHYLLAILRSQGHATWINRVSQELQRGIAGASGAETAPSLPTQAARLWLAQMVIYAKALEIFPNAASLDAEVFFNQPGDVLSACFSHFGQPQERATLGAIVASELFTRYSKDPKMAYTNDTRLNLQGALRRELGGALAEARRWIEGQPVAARLPSKLAKPLVGDGCELLGSA